MQYNVGDIVKLSTDHDVRSGKVLKVEGVLVTVGWANGSRTVFSARVLERLTSPGPSPLPWTEPQVQPDPRQNERAPYLE